MIDHDRDRAQPCCFHYRKEFKSKNGKEGGGNIKMMKNLGC
jgi:hypothetical protein